MTLERPAEPNRDQFKNNFPWFRGSVVPCFRYAYAIN